MTTTPPTEPAPIRLRFGPCEIDEARRSFSAHGRELKLQPRVFDVLCHLVRHRARVVGKDELLDALWPGTVVVDNALQRVVSLARAALADAGLSNVVRTYARHGYRFCWEDCADEGGAVVEAPSADAPAGPLAEAQAALERQDWAAASAAYAAADAASTLPPEVVEQWGRAAICAGLGGDVAAALERSVAERDAAGDALGAARATLLLVQIRIDKGQPAMANGLLQRASRYLDGTEASTERGHYAWMASRFALGSGRTDEALALADQAFALGRQLRDADVECLGLVYRGHALMAGGHAAQALAQHEEAAAVVRLGGVRSWVAGWALCSILFIARYRADWPRAVQYADTFTEWARTSNMPAFPGTCQLHRAAVLGAQGELDRAEAEARGAIDMLARAAPWAEGDAHCVLGDVLLDKGEIEAAMAAYRRAHALGWNPQPGLARLHLLTGRPEQAWRELENALDHGDWTQRERRLQLQCLLAIAAVAAGNPERARRALQEVADAPELLVSDAQHALHTVAQAELALAEGERAHAARKLREAVRLWRAAGVPSGEGQARLRLAECLLMGGDSAGSEMELHAVESALADVMLPHRSRMVALRQALAA